MNIALLSDVHSNYPALEAVLTDLPSKMPLVFCGDIIGYYMQPNEVCDTIRSLNACTIRGNHESMILNESEKNSTRDSFYRKSWTRDCLSKENHLWLKSLPTTLCYDFGNLHLTVRHASPWDERTYLYPDSPEIKKIILKQNELLVVGHTHRQMVTKAGLGRIVNPGSVGQPRNGSPDANYAILNTRSREITLKTIKYNHEAYMNELLHAGWHSKAVDMLKGKR